MFNNVALDIIIGLMFIFLMYSLLTTTVQEIIAQIIGMRASDLRKGIGQMLHGSTLVDAFYNHPLIVSLAKTANNKFPSYITPDNFSRVMSHLLRGDNFDHTSPQIELIRRTLFPAGQRTDCVTLSDCKIEGQPLQYLRMMWVDANNDIDKFKGLLEQWFQDSMDRLSGRYKRKNQAISFIIGLILAGIFNVDTIAIAKILAHNKNARDQLASMAVEKYATLDAGQLAQAGKTTEFVDNIKSGLDSTSFVLGLGYPDPKLSLEHPGVALPLTLLGWLITALAISLGAPFWFDLLGRLIQLRGTGPKPDPGGGGAIAAISPGASPVNRKG